MTVHVCFVSISDLSPGSSADFDPAMGACRRKEVVALNGVTTGAAQDGEGIIVYNDTAAAIMVAIGSAPDAATATTTATSSAGLPVLANAASPIIEPTAGDKVSVKALA